MSLAIAINSKLSRIAVDPATINGRLLPYMLVEISDQAPTIGYIINPESGPASQAQVSKLLDNPKDST